MAIALLSAGEWLGLAGGLLGLVLLAGQGWVLVHVLTQNGRLLIRLDELEARTGIQGKTRFSTQSLAGVGLPIGATAPNFRLPGLHGETLTLDAFRVKGAPVLLLLQSRVWAMCRPPAGDCPLAARARRSNHHRRPQLRRTGCQPSNGRRTRPGVRPAPEGSRGGGGLRVGRDTGRGPSPPRRHHR